MDNDIVITEKLESSRSAKEFGEASSAKARLDGLLALL